MRRLMRGYYRGEKGFTLLELLIVVVILGILAGILVPRLIAFFGTGHQAAANDEVAKVEAAAMAYYADTGGQWPNDTNTLGSDNSLMDGPGNEVYLDQGADYANYTFDDPLLDPDNGKVYLADGTLSSAGPAGIDGLKWDYAAHKWVKE